MSVLQRKQLEDSPLADLHAIASELGVEGFRAMRKDDLIGAILRAQGADDEAESATAIEEPEPDEVPAEEALAQADTTDEPLPDVYPALALSAVGDGVVIRVGLPEWADRIGTPEVAQVTHNIVDILRGVQPRIRSNR